MLYKSYPKRERKRKKAKYRLNNWAEYERGLKSRGSLTVWFSEEAIQNWHSSEGAKKRGGQKVYSDLAIEVALTIRMLFQLPLRQTEGFLESLAVLLNLQIKIPDHTTLSRRAKNLSLSPLHNKRGKAVHLIVDSAGLTTYNRAETKLSKKMWKGWRRLHLAIDEEGNILASELTPNDVGDVTQVPNLLGQVDNKILSFTGDGAYDTKEVYDILETMDPEGPVQGIMPPQCNATFSKNADESPTQRDRHIKFIREKGRLAWQRISGYTRRNKVEGTNKRYKMSFGEDLRSRKLDNQKTEISIGCRILNKMLELGRPRSYRVK